MDKNGRRARPASVNIPAFTMKVVESEKNLFCYALCNRKGEPVLPKQTYVTASCAISSETVLGELNGIGSSGITRQQQCHVTSRHTPRCRRTSLRLSVSAISTSRSSQTSKNSSKRCAPMRLERLLFHILSLGVQSPDQFVRTAETGSGKVQDLYKER